MPYIKSHPLLEPLPEIKHHNQLADTQVKLAELPYTQTNGLNTVTDTYSFIKQGSNLSIVKSYKVGPENRYSCAQFDYPLKALSWFPPTLEAFRNGDKLEGEGGSGMTTPDMDVDNEFLTIDRHTEGYGLNNWSRNYNRHDEEHFRPVMLSLDSEFLYDQGLLETWIKLGRDYENGKFGI